MFSFCMLCNGFPIALFKQIRQVNCTLVLGRKNRIKQRKEKSSSRIQIKASLCITCIGGDTDTKIIKFSKETLKIEIKFAVEAAKKVA